MNKVILIGRLARNPELKWTDGGTAICRFTIAVDRKFKKEGQPDADFLQVTVWNKIAENVANYCQKGRLVGVAGRIENREYEGKDGTKKYATEIQAEEVQFLEKMKIDPVPLEDFGGKGMKEVPPDDDMPF